MLLQSGPNRPRNSRNSVVALIIRLAEGDEILLSRTYRPSEELAPFIRRFYVFEAELPSDLVIEDFLLAETAFVRILINGDWSGEVAPGEWSRPSDALFFGANRLPFKVRVKGSFKVVGFAIKPSGWRALFTKPHHKFADMLLPLSDLWGELAQDMLTSVKDANDDEAMISAMSNAIRARLDQIGNPKPDKAMERFENIARTDSTMRIDEAADVVGMTIRTLERHCRDCFGLTPKAILRRSRFLDMATAMRGFSSPDETILAELRYFDESHRSREFKRFTQMTPGEFENAMTPLQTAGLKLREESLHEE